MLHHTGGAPGVSTDITIDLSHGIGVITLANADYKGPALHDITLTILRKLPGQSMPANFSAHPWTQFQSASMGPRRAREEGLSMARELPHLDLTGTYDDVGYGTVTLCDAS